MKPSLKGFVELVSVRGKLLDILSVDQCNKLNRIDLTSKCFKLYTVLHFLSGSLELKRNATLINQQLILSN